MEECLTSGISALASGYDEINNGILSIGKLMADPSSEAMKNLETLKGGISTLSTNYDLLDKGINEYTKGVASLKSGLDEIAGGANKLAAGSKDLLDGSNSLASGADTLNDGLNKFNDEGISELSTKVNDALSELDSAIDTVNELLDESSEYTNYAGSSSYENTSVTFIMKTDEVTKKEEDKQEVSIETSEQTSLLQRFLNLFKKNK